MGVKDWNKVVECRTLLADRKDQDKEIERLRACVVARDEWLSRGCPRVAYGTSGVVNGCEGCTVLPRCPKTTHPLDGDESEAEHQAANNPDDGRWKGR